MAKKKNRGFDPQQARKVSLFRRWREVLLPPHYIETGLCSGSVT